MKVPKGFIGFVDSLGNPLPRAEQRRLEQEKSDRYRSRNARQLEIENSRKAIERFKEEQAQQRNWISVAEIVDWRSRDRNTGARRKKYLRTALNDFDLAIRDGKYFFVSEQSRILLLLPFPVLDEPDPNLSETLKSDPIRLPEQYWLSTVGWFAQRELILDPTASETDRLVGMFDRCLQWAWIPRELCLLWSENVPFEPKPEWLAHRVKKLSVPSEGGSDPWPMSTAAVQGAASNHANDGLTPLQTPQSEPKPQPPRRIAESQIEPEFKSWRASQADSYIPTEPEDVAHMKQLGVGRDTVRALRKNYQSRKRGEKKTVS